MENYIKNLKIGFKVASIIFLACGSIGLENKITDAYAATYNKNQISLKLQGVYCVSEEEILKQIEKMNLQVPKVTCEGYGTSTDEKSKNKKNDKKKETKPSDTNEVTYGAIREAILEQMKKMGLKVPN